MAVKSDNMTQFPKKYIENESKYLQDNNNYFYGNCFPMNNSSHSSVTSLYKYIGGVECNASKRHRNPNPKCTLNTLAIAIVAGGVGMGCQ